MEPEDALESGPDLAPENSPDNVPESAPISEPPIVASRRSGGKQALLYIACGLLVLGIVCVVISALIDEILGLDKSAWLGVKVLPKSGAVVTSRNMVLNTRKWTVPYIVQDVQGQRFLIGDKEQGWVWRREVVTLDEAPAYYTRLIHSGQDTAWAFHMRAIVWHEKGDLDRAIEDYSRATQSGPRDANAYFGRGCAWYEKGEYDKALVDFGHAIHLDPEDASAYEFRGHAHFAKQEYDEAIADYEQALRLDPQDAYTYNSRGNAWRGKAEYDKALADFDTALRLDPQDAQSLRSSAWIRATCSIAQYRNGALAVKDATKACELTNWTDAQIVLTLAAAYAEVGEFDAAIKYQRQAISLRPSDENFVNFANDCLALYSDKQPYRSD